ncbi:lysosome-associated membrane glycoprotein 3 [Bombina bombina]|uniref:lysosome-associated membrane glycoprotein 3 n=1 Tax=Bombina bombina TaxID=8345 RepID=UPI00235B0B15|nr:lysosome-associated membrane glycoprotein 3 [Bombina bombina]
MDKDKGPCIIAVMGLELELDKNKGYYNVVPKDTTATGKCSDEQANLNLTFPEGSINFMFVKNKNYYHIDAIAFRFAYGSGHWNGSIQNQSLLTTDNGYSVKCKHMPVININETKIAMFDVKLQAFDFTSGDFGKEEECYQDRNKNLVPLAVSLASLGLVLIILVVFLLARRKRSEGYERI